MVGHPHAAASATGTQRALVTRPVIKSPLLSPSQIDFLQQVMSLLDHLIVVYPDIALACERVDMCLCCPVGVGLAAVGIAEGNVNARLFLVLEHEAVSVCWRPEVSSW